MPRLLLAFLASQLPGNSSVPTLSAGPLELICEAALAGLCTHQNCEQAVFNLEMWDIAGQERYQSLLPMYTRKAQGVVLCYNITETHSFEEAFDRFAQSIVTYTPECRALVVMGCYADLEHKRKVSTEEGAAAAHKLQEEIGAGTTVLFIETSAKTGYQVHEAFIQLVMLLIPELQVHNVLWNSIDQKS